MSKSVISWIIGVVGLGGGGFAGVRAFITKLEREIDLVINEINKVQLALNKVLATVNPATPVKSNVLVASKTAVKNTAPSKSSVKKPVAKRK